MAAASCGADSVGARTQLAQQALGSLHSSPLLRLPQAQPVLLRFFVVGALAFWPWAAPSSSAATSRSSSLGGLPADRGMVTGYAKAGMWPAGARRGAGVTAQTWQAAFRRARGLSLLFERLADLFCTDWDHFDGGPRAQEGVRVGNSLLSDCGTAVHYSTRLIMC